MERFRVVEQTECDRQRGFKLYVVAGRRDSGAVSGSIRAQSVPGPEKVNEKACRNHLSRQALSVGATGFEPATS